LVAQKIVKPPTPSGIALYKKSAYLDYKIVGIGKNLVCWMEKTRK